MRPPGWASKTTSSPGSAVTVWVTGHQLEVFAVQTSNACATGHSTTSESLRGSIMGSWAAWYSPPGDGNGQTRRPTPPAGTPAQPRPHERGAGRSDAGLAARLGP